ncbi:MAG: hypothetical protein K8R68_03535, partial [Bacteroidales bacterium]|nr:hypothetical protein [Bacteroidales bacterium]
REVFEAMMKDSGLNLSQLKVDGGMTVNELLMQFQADILDLEVIRPVVTETTALGAAYAAGLAVGFWKSTEDLKRNWNADKSWKPDITHKKREEEYALINIKTKYYEKTDTNFNNRNSFNCEHFCTGSTKF